LTRKTPRINTPGLRAGRGCSYQRPNLPRYGMGRMNTSHQAGKRQLPKQTARRLSRAGKRLMGFCRTNLFKRLEAAVKRFSNPSSAHFAELHFLHAIEIICHFHSGRRIRDCSTRPTTTRTLMMKMPTASCLRRRRRANPTASQIESRHARRFQKTCGVSLPELFHAVQSRFKWLRPDLFAKSLGKDLAMMEQCS